MSEPFPRTFARRAAVLLLLLLLPGAAAPGATALDRQFTETVRPFVTRYCLGCHGGQTPAAQLDLKAYPTIETVIQDYQRWTLVQERLAAQEMPPPKIGLQPPAEARKQIIDWIQAVRSEQARKNDGDPGLVLARRLSNAEYNYTIRDLTGVDLRPAREFPVDPANPAGFDNSGESLTMSSSLLKKYLQAARETAGHMVLTPDGFDFAPWPMLVETDREKYAIQRIVSFYFSQPTGFDAYFEAAWRYKHRAALGQPNATLASIAAGSNISPKYLPLVWQLIEEPAAKAKTEVGPIAKLQAMWRGLPAPGTHEVETQLRSQCAAMRDFVVRIRSHTAMQFAAPLVAGLPAGSQPLLNWKLREFAAHRRQSDPRDLRNDTDPPPIVPEIPRYPGLHREAAPRWAALTARARAGDTDLIVPAAERSRYEASFARFASVFPDTFYITERGRYFPDDSEDKGRLLSAGYHSVVGFYRDDSPLVELILDEKQRKHLDRLWDEFDFIADFTARTWVQYFFNQSGEVDGKGAESGSPRPPGHAITDAEVILKKRDAYLAKAAANPSNDPIAPRAIREHFDGINATLRNLEKVRAAAEPKHLDALLNFAARAYRRPLTSAERDDLIAYYHKLRQKNELSHEDAIRDCIAGVLMAPDFLYRIDLNESSSASVRPLSNYALAARLSYFLWSSMPDPELNRHAALGDLRQPGVLLAQTRRMLKDGRVRNFATEFAANWLDFRRFENFNSVDRARFPSFNNELREAMFQEPIRFVEDVIRNGRSALDMLYGKYTFVNPVLAKHYGIPGVKGNADNWVRVGGADKYGRGGLLPMSVFLTNTSPGLRTSPVKRGYWVVHRLLGETIPPPPAVVPELPQDESKTDLPLRDVLAQHRANPVCAGCHAKFDVFGLALENYGPIGEARTRDLAGRPVDTAVTLPGGVQGSGFESVQAFIKSHRQKEFVEGLCRKLVVYGLNRSLQLSDEPLIERMSRQERFDALIEAIVTSPQFLNKRFSGLALQPQSSTILERKGE
jgi:hypothetical protein